MALEQLEGREADTRTDIFALGAVVYEMATGRKAFEAKSRASLIAAILEREPPPVSSVRPLAPPILSRVVATCPAKKPDDRWQSARDLPRGLAPSLWLNSHCPSASVRGEPFQSAPFNSSTKGAVLRADRMN